MVVERDQQVEEEFTVSNIQQGAELVYAQTSKKDEPIKAVCYLRLVDGRQVGVKVNRGLPQFTEEIMAQVDEVWSKKKTILIARQIAMAAGLNVEILDNESTISTTHMIKLGLPET